MAKKTTQTVYAKYIGPKKHRPKWLYGKGVTKKMIALHLKAHREQYPQYYVMPTDESK